MPSNSRKVPKNTLVTEKAIHQKYSKDKYPTRYCIDKHLPDK